MRKLYVSLPILVGLVGVAFALSAGACTSGSLAPAGAECLQATDCEEGLVCIPQGGKRVCSADLTGIVNLPAEAGAADATVNDAALDVINYDGTVDSPPPPKDQSAPDVAPPQDSGGGQDSGGSQDAGGG